ncbi:MAG: 1-acyl-sn-glycerol-3-phosphate acyltransferase [Deltaproteobacteria bacterium]|nr:1-acyl-sn-glycerol-3-phosphate acyltransferase [Deltaproteobacteria bacterium]
MRIILVLVSTLLWGVLACVTGLVDRSGEGVIQIARIWACWVVKICRLQVEVKGAEGVDCAHPCIFMSNHQSALDIVVLIATIPTSFRFIAKKELAVIPVFGWAMAMGGHIFVDRGDRARAIVSLKQAEEKIRRGVKVILFPEGTRSRTGELAEFKRGGFHLAIGAQVPIVPVSISGSRNRLPKRSRRLDPGVIKVVYGQAVPTQGYSVEGREQVIEKVRRGILAGMDEALQKPTR